MARCGCASGTCSCVVTGAGGVVVTGVGSADNPYVVNAPIYSVVDSPTVDLELTGSGTALDPYRLTANVHLALDQLSDVSASAPTAGYVLTYVTSPAVEWRAAVPTSGIPGAVLHDSTMLGDGTPSSALGVKLDPGGGITVTGSGLRAPSYETVCLSTTRPPSPALRDRIYETDTKATGWYDSSVSRWMMTDSVPQPYTPVINTVPAANAYIGNGSLYGFYMRAGLLCTTTIQFHQGSTTYMGWDTITFTLPFTAIGSPLELNDYHHGSAYLEPAGWYAFNGLPFIQPGAKRIMIYGPANLENSDVHPIRNAWGNSNPGNSVPQRPGAYAWNTGSWIEASITYVMSNGVT